MGLLDLARSLFRRAPADPVDEARALARLLLAELRLYNQEAVDALGRRRPPPDEFLEEVKRSYAMFVRRVRGGPATAGVFLEEGAKAWTGGDVALLRELLPGAFDLQLLREAK